MPHDVFISYSSKDKQSADAVCAVLERNGIRCWIAPRDILPGKPWSASIINAINNSKVLILVFSENANSSQQIEREVERAISKAIPVIPVRIEEVQPSDSLEYFISSSHWLDAFTQPFEQHLERVADAVRRILEIDQPSAASRLAGGTDQSAPAPAPAPVPAPVLSAENPHAVSGTGTPDAAKKSPRGRRWLWASIVVLAILAVGAFAVGQFGNGSQPTKAAFPLYARTNWIQTNQTVPECMNRARDKFRDFKMTAAASETFVAWSDDYTFMVRCTSLNLVFFSIVAPPNSSSERDRYAGALFDDVTGKW